MLKQDYGKETRRGGEIWWSLQKGERRKKVQERGNSLIERKGYILVKEMTGYVKGWRKVEQGRLVMAKGQFTVKMDGVAGANYGQPWLEYGRVRVKYGQL